MSNFKAPSTVDVPRGMYDRGMKFHVFGDQEAWGGAGLEVKFSYHTSWLSLETAQAVARLLDNGYVYNNDGELVE